MQRLHSIYPQQNQGLILVTVQYSQSKNFYTKFEQTVTVEKSTHQKEIVGFEPTE